MAFWIFNLGTVNRIDSGYRALKTHIETLGLELFEDESKWIVSRAVQCTIQQHWSWSYTDLQRAHFPLRSAGWTIPRFPTFLSRIPHSIAYTKTSSAQVLEAFKFIADAQYLELESETPMLVMHMIIAFRRGLEHFHTEPADVCIAIATLHVITARSFLDRGSAIWAVSRVVLLLP